MSDRLGGPSWSVEVPVGWDGQDDPECATLTQVEGEGALQLSCHTKESGDVTDDDLRDFAADRVDEGATLVPSQFGDFSGFGTSFAEDGAFWWNWWLRNGHAMLFVTFNSPVPTKLEDLAEVLNTLKHHEAAGA